MYRARSVARVARASSVMRIIVLLPPAIRSMKGPMSGVTIANGAMVKRRYRAIFGLAESGSRKKSEPASATAIIASAAALERCVIAILVNGLRGGFVSLTLTVSGYVNLSK